jgi:TonB-linked SusC/RagA family outer membrane protein
MDLRGLAKTLRIMKITASILLIACLHVSARSFSQRVSLRESKAPLDKVFREIREQTGYTFVYTESLLKETSPVTMDVRDMSLDSVLEICFRTQPVGYEIVEKTVVVKPKVAEVPATAVVVAPQNDIQGRVVDSAGNPLEGASIQVKGTKIVVASDRHGRFEIKNVDAGEMLEISYTGYQSREVKIISGQLDLTIQLTISNNPLDEIQIIAYGATTQRLNTGNVTTINAKEIEQQPVDNPLLALEGRVPGMFITQSNGLPGSGVLVRIQGQNSIQEGTDPLYVIDGVPIASQMLATTSGGIGGILGTSGGVGVGNPLSYINPNDIESISILKDADATSIYGSRAANGAVLITTKKGKIGGAKLDINLQQGYGAVTRRIGLMNTPEYLQMRHEALLNDGLTPGPTDYDINGLWDTTRYTDWQKVLLGGSAHYTNLNGSVSGGNLLTQYLIGASYHRETTVFPGDFADQKGSVHFNIASGSGNQRFKIQLTGFYLFDNNQLPGLDLTTNAVSLAPDAPALYKPDGTLNWMPDANGVSSWGNPLAPDYIVYHNNTSNLVGNALLSYQLLRGLTLKSSFGYTNLQTNELEGLPIISQAPEYQPYATRTAYYSYSTINTWIIEPQLEYKRNLGENRIDLLAGATIEQNNDNGLNMTGSGYNSDSALPDIHSASTVLINSTILSTYKYNAAFGRFNYSYNDRYILDITVRRDGSSRFGPQTQFHNFGSLGGAWIFSEENFFKNDQKWISFGKVRGSYGTTGSDQIGDYQFMNLYQPIPANVPYQGISALGPIGLTNPYLEWEETRKLQFGLDIGMFKNSILFTVNYNHNRSSNELLYYPLPSITGFGGITENLPATIQNAGWEMTLNTKNVNTKEFSWNSSINLTIPRNKLVAFPNLQNSSYAETYIIGQPVSIRKTFVFDGVNPSTGTYQFDSKGGPTSSPAYGTDQTAIVNTLPKFYGGFQNSFRYKGFELEFLFQFVRQVGSNYYFGKLIPGAFFGGNGNEPVSVLSRWQQPGDITSIQRYTSGFSLFGPYFYATGSNRAFSDASFIRFKNLSFSWYLPSKWQQRVRLQNSRLFINAQNLFTITRFDGMDPENQSVSALPPLRIITAGLQVGL